ncbi:MAG: hypothetical protein IPL46_20845 [Saprospiraceae bacterium]|nr:hypothetical protein [Saprospiraceae bacterium]
MKGILLQLTLFMALIPLCRVTAQGCLMTPEMIVSDPPFNPANLEFSKMPLDRCLTIYAETDYFTYLAFGGDKAAVANWLKAIYEQVALIYAAENVTISLASYYIPDTSGGWSDGLSAIDLMYQFGGVVKEEANGRVKMFITRRILGGGNAWQNELCMNSRPANVVNYTGGYRGPYAVCGNMTAHVTPISESDFSWNIQVVSHELGHVIGLKHTHSCSYGPNFDMAVDNCYTQQGGSCDVITPVENSTIMSYCHFTSLGISFEAGFGTYPGNQLRAAIMNASCLVMDEMAILTGELNGIIAADSIILSDVQATNLILKANTLTIETGELYATFEVMNSGCQ